MSFLPRGLGFLFFSSGAGDDARDTEPCFRPGVLLVRDTGVLERPSTLSPSASFSLRFFGAGFFAVPFFVAADPVFLFAVGLTEVAGEDRSDVDARDALSFLRFAEVVFLLPVAGLTDKAGDERSDAGDTREVFPLLRFANFFEVGWSCVPSNIGLYSKSSPAGSIFTEGNGISSGGTGGALPLALYTSSKTPAPSVLRPAPFLGRPSGSAM